MCLLALTALLHAAFASIKRCREIQKVAVEISRTANKTHPHSFHVPTDVKKECLDTALMCFRSQVPNLHVAAGKSKVEFASYIRKIKASKPHDREECTPCSKYAKQSPEEFLNKLELLLQE
ncbi:hypothetical protein PRIEUP_LOCUS16809, partial [Pristimantis euphronides]